MKKLALIIVMVCFVLSFTFAQEYKPAATIEGNAKLLVGYNADKFNFGWKSVVDANLKITLVPKNSAEKTGEGMYGYIQLKDFQWVINDTTSKPSVTAKLVFDPLYLKFADGVAVGGNWQDTITAADYSMATLDSFNLTVVSNVVASESSLKGNLLEAGVTFAPVSLVVKAVTTNDYTNCAVVEPANDFWFGAFPTVTLGDLKIEAGTIFAYGVEGFDPAFGAKVSYSLPLTEAIKLTPSVGFDYTTDDTAAAQWSVGGGVYATWAGSSKWALIPGATSCDGWTNIDAADGDDNPVADGAGVGFNYNEAKVLNVVVQAADAVGDDGLLPGVGFAAALELGDLTGDAMKLGFRAMTSYSAGDIKPYVAAVYKDKNAAGNTDGSFALAAGVDVAKILPNTALNLEYRSVELVGTPKSNGVAAMTITVSF